MAKELADDPLKKPVTFPPHNRRRGIGHPIPSAVPQFLFSLPGEKQRSTVDIYDPSLPPGTRQYDFQSGNFIVGPLIDRAGNPYDPTSGAGPSYADVIAAQTKNAVEVGAISQDDAEQIIADAAGGGSAYTPGYVEGIAAALGVPVPNPVPPVEVGGITSPAPTDQNPISEPIVIGQPVTAGPATVNPVSDFPVWYDALGNVLEAFSDDSGNALVRNTSTGEITLVTADGNANDYDPNTRQVIGPSHLALPIYQHTSTGVWFRLDIATGGLTTVSAPSFAAVQSGPGDTVNISPAPQTVRYYNKAGNPYTNEPQSYWQTADGAWYMGDKNTGQITLLAGPPWPLNTGWSPVTVFAVGVGALLLAKGLFK